MKNTWFIRNSYWFFILLIIAIPAGQASIQILTVIGYILGISLLFNSPKILINELKKSHYLFCYLMLFLPIGLSLIDSIAPINTVKVLYRAMLYFGIGIIAALISVKQNKKMVKIVFYICLFICLDAMTQWIFNVNIFGKNPAINGRVRGVFGNRYHLSYFIATLSPIIFFYLLSLNVTKKVKLILAFILLLLVTWTVIVGGARAGIVTLLVSILIFGLYLLKYGYIKNIFIYFSAISIALVLSVVIAFQTDAVQERFNLTTKVATNESFLERFTTKRTQLWRIAVDEIPHYLINGVGARAYVEIYKQAPVELKQSRDMNHPHLYFLQLLLETGVLGLICYLVVCGYLVYKIYTASAGVEWLMVSFLAMMPINSHVGFYETYWMPLVWAPLGLGLLLSYKAEQEKRCSNIFILGKI